MATKFLSRDKIFVGDVMARKYDVMIFISKYLYFKVSDIIKILMMLLGILTGKKHRQMKLQRLQKVWIWRFGWFIHKMISLLEVFKLKQNFQKNKVATGKTLFFVIVPFWTHHSISLNIGFWHGSFVWKWCVFSLSAFI